MKHYFGVKSTDIRFIARFFPWHKKSLEEGGDGEEVVKEKTEKVPPNLQKSFGRF